MCVFYFHCKSNWIWIGRKSAHQYDQTTPSNPVESIKSHSFILNNSFTNDETFETAFFPHWNWFVKRYCNCFRIPFKLFSSSISGPLTFQSFVKVHDKDHFKLYHKIIIGILFRFVLPRNDFHFHWLAVGENAMIDLNEAAFTSNQKHAWTLFFILAKQDYWNCKDRMNMNTFSAIDYICMRLHSATKSVNKDRWKIKTIYQFILRLIVWPNLISWRLLDVRLTFNQFWTEHAFIAQAHRMIVWMMCALCCHFKSNFII